MSNAFEILDRRITAYHEAAHAVVALKFGIRVTEVALCRSSPLSGYVITRRRRAVSKLENRISRSSELTWTLVTRDLENRAIVFLAGPVAEAKLLGKPLRSHGGQSDFSECLQLCRVLDRYRRHLADKYGLTLPKEQPADMANRLARRAARILAHPNTWQAVTALAEELGGWSTLTGHEAADTVQWTRRIENQFGLRLPPSVESPRPRRIGPGSQRRNYLSSLISAVNPIGRDFVAAGAISA